jgi:hypothetical protein
MKITPIIKIASKQLVDSLLSMNINNRRVKKSVVETYKQDIADGRWMLTNQGIGIDSNNVLIDGQHRLIAIKESGYPPVSLLVVYGLDPKSQACIDQHAKRTVRDIWRLVFDSSVGTQAPAVCGVIYKSQNGWPNGALSATRLKDVLDIYIEEIEFFLSQVTKNKWAAPYIASFVIKAKNNPSRMNDLITFMKSVEAGEMLTRSMPEFHLRNMLMSSQASKGGGDMQKERFHKCNKAIQAFLDGEEMRLLRA